MEKIPYEKIPYEAFEEAVCVMCRSKLHCTDCPIKDVVPTCCMKSVFALYDGDETYSAIYPILFLDAQKENVSTRRQILESAIQCVCSDREAQYGSPEDSFNRIAKLWTAYNDIPYTAHDVAMMMSLLKVARIAEGRFKDDNYVDLAGYAACAAEIGGSK